MESLWPVALAILVVLAGLLGYGILRRRRRALPARSAAPSQGPLATLERALAKTRERFGARLDAAFGRAGASPDAALTELEEVLVSADVGVRVASDLVAGLRSRLGRTADPAALRDALRAELEA